MLSKSRHFPPTGKSSWPDKQILSLTDGQLWSLQSKRMLYLQVLSGRIWLTITDDRQDYWLSAGAQIQLPASRQIVLEASGSAARLHLLNLDQSSALRLPRLIASSPQLLCLSDVRHGDGASWTTGCRPAALKT